MFGERDKIGRMENGWVGSLGNIIITVTFISLIISPF